MVGIGFNDFHTDRNVDFFYMSSIHLKKYVTIENGMEYLSIGGVVITSFFPMYSVPHSQIWLSFIFKELLPNCIEAF